MELVHLVTIPEFEVSYTRTKNSPVSSGLKPPKAVENPWIVRILGGTLAAGMLCGVAGVVRLVYADHLAQSDSVEQARGALKVMPGNADYWLHWADLIDADGRSSRTAIEHAVQVDPYNATVWIRAGLAAELNGDDAGAEQDFLEAARRSRQYEPRWALANFYFRHGDLEQFWPWTKNALVSSYKDRKLLFDLSWRVQPDAGIILDRAIPDNPDVLRDYLGFLLNSNRSQAALAVAERIASRASEDDRDILLAYVNRMLEAAHWQNALSVWNALCLRKIIPYQPLDPHRGQSLTNGAFAIESLNSGFDWRMPQVSGVSTAHSDSTSGMRFDFDGEQPEQSWLIYQFVPLQPLRRYDLQFAYRTDGIPEGSGLRWRVLDACSGLEIPLEPESLPTFSSTGWTKSVVSFVVPRQVQTVKVVLVYQRQPGTVRIEGALWLRNVGLELHP